MYVLFTCVALFLLCQCYVFTHEPVVCFNKRPEYYNWIYCVAMSRAWNGSFAVNQCSDDTAVRF